MIVIRNALVEDYEQIEAIMQQVQQMHVSWRSDIYCPCSPVLSLKFFQQLLKEHSLFVAEYDGVTAGVMILEQRHIENPTHVTMDILFVDTMAVDEKYRHKGIGHAFFDYVKTIKQQKNFDSIELQVNARNEDAMKMYAAILLTGLGDALTVNMRIVPNPGDGIVNAIGQVSGKDMGFSKNLFDSFCVIIKLVIGLFTSRLFYGIGPGTVIAVLATGRVIHIINQFTKYRLDTLAGL